MIPPEVCHGTLSFRCTLICYTQVLLGYFGTLSPEIALECLKTLLAANPSGNAQLCAQIASGLCQVVGGGALILPLMMENAALLARAQDAAEERDLASLENAALRDEINHLKHSTPQLTSSVPAATVDSLPLDELDLLGGGCANSSPSGASAAADDMDDLLSM